MYPTYSWNALILGSNPVSDADKRFCILSAQEGSIWARAKSVREERSKLRFSLAEYTLTRVSLVRGRYGWRITGAIHVRTIVNMRARAAFARLSRLVQRLTVPDAYDAQRVYTPLLCAHEALSQSDGAYDEIEILTALRILFVLGYVAPRSEYESFLHGVSCDDALLAVIRDKRTTVLADINKALSESQL